MIGKIFDIKKYAVHDGPGIRTTVFFSGCPLNCLWCHNPEALNDSGISKSSNEKCLSESIAAVKEFTHEKLFDEIIKDEIFYDDSGGGVTFSGGEPMMQIDFLVEILSLCKSRGIKTAIDTTGFASQKHFEIIYPNTDLFLYDLKLIDNDKHKEFTGTSNNLILENLNYLTKAGNKVRIRIPLIPGFTDTIENLSGIADHISKLRNIISVDLLPYNKISEDKYRRLRLDRKIPEMQTQSETELQQIKSLFIKTGFKIKLRG